jgi:hypothetical protein
MRIAVGSLVAVLIVGVMAFAGPQTPRVSDVTVTRQVIDGRPGPAETAMPPETGEIFVWFRHQDLPPGAEVSAVWRYLGGSDPLRIGQSSVSLPAGSSSANFSMQLAPGKAWPEGPYRVDVVVDDRTLGLASFRIERTGAVPAAPVPDAHRYLHPRTGFSLAPPEGWTLDDATDRADLQMKAGGGAGLVEITSGPTSARLDPVSYAAGWESMAVGPGRLLLAKRQGHPSTVDHETAYEAVYQGSGVLSKVVFVATPTRMFVITAVFGTGDFAAGEVIFDKVMQSLRLPAR